MDNAKGVQARGSAGLPSWPAWILRPHSTLHKPRVSATVLEKTTMCKVGCLIAAFFEAMQNVQGIAEYGSWEAALLYSECIRQGGVAAPTTRWMTRSLSTVQALCKLASVVLELLRLDEICVLLQVSLST